MDIFISYRREGGLDFSARLHEKLLANNYSAFFDIESMKSGRFDEQIYKKIEKSDNFILVLSPHALDRCINDDDWVRLEVEKAIALKKNIILLFMPKFEFPTNLPPSLSILLRTHGVYYYISRGGFTTAYKELLKLLIDSTGEPLLETKKRKKSNTYYETVGMKPAEMQRIIKDYTICKEIEQNIFAQILKKQKDVVVFNPAIYEISSTMQKYSYFPQISHVYGFVCNQATAEEANQNYGQERNKFYAGNMEDADFENKMDIILGENHLNGFDFVDLTLILKDSENPLTKLSLIVERLSPHAFIYVRELDDDLVIGYPDTDKRLEYLVKLLSINKYAGNRHIGRSVLTYMKNSGAAKVKMFNTILTTAGMKMKQRKMLFDTYFSYLEPEIDDLIKEHPDNELYISAKHWLTNNYKTVEQSMISLDSLFISGFMFFYGEYIDE